MYTTPTVVGDVVYIGSCSGHFQALDVETGSVIWDYDATVDGEATSFHGNPLLIDSLIITGTDAAFGGVLCALSARTGVPVWTYPVEGGYTTDLVRRGQNVYAVARSDELACIDTRTGELIWYYREPTDARPSMSSSPAIRGDRVFFGTRSGSIVALTADSGRVIWSRDLGSLVGTSIVLDEEALYVGTADANVYRISQADGKILGSIALEAPGVGLGTIGNPVLTEKAFLILRDGGAELVGLSRSLDRVLWKQASAKRWSSFRPHLWRGMVLVGDDDGAFRGFDPADGSLHFSEQFEGTVRGIGSAGDMLFIGTLQGTVYAYAAGPEE